MNITIADAKELAKKRGLRTIIIFGWDGEQQHVATYGKSLEDCALAADLGNKMKSGLGWPKALTDTEPSRVEKLKKELADLKFRMEGLEK